MASELRGYRANPGDESYKMGLLSSTRMLASHFNFEIYQIHFDNMVEWAERLMGYAITEGKLEQNA